VLTSLDDRGYSTVVPDSATLRRLVAARQWRVVAAVDDMVRVPWRAQAYHVASPWGPVDVFTASTSETVIMLDDPEDCVWVIAAPAPQVIGGLIAAAEGAAVIPEGWSPPAS